MQRITNIQILDFATNDCHLGAIDTNHKGAIVKVHQQLPEETFEGTTYDGHGAYAMPGLINAHAHLFAAGQLPKSRKVAKRTIDWAYRCLKTPLGKQLLRRQMLRHAQTELAAGVTTLRSVGEFFYQDVWLRDAIAAGKLVGPRLQVSGFFLSVTAGHGAPYLALEGDSPWEGRRNVRKQQKAGVDWIKICVTGGVTDAKRLGEAGALQMTEAEIAAICEEAHKNGTPVCAHVESSEGVRIALRAGVDSIEHGAEMDDEIIALYQNNPKSLRGFSTLVPTFQAAAPFAMLPQAETGLGDIVYQNGRMVYEDMVQSYQQARAHGLQIGVGNDASMTFVTHYDFWRELEHQARLGSDSPTRVLDRATRGNATLLGLENSVGQLAEGFQADILLVAADPRESLEVLRDIQAVFSGGKLVEVKPTKRFTHLDTLLDRLVGTSGTKTSAK